ncbi:PTS sugar transporter subunit IIC [Liquorilactobacillus nagelii]|uniref:PTS sugar transporter subunit IIC n=1 Tax=Liquorilactobacillus nagelii TaxID=82688 RepID=UPI0039EC0C01
MENTATAHTTTVKEYAYWICAAVANAILVTLGIGLLLQTLASFIHWNALYQVGIIANELLAPALGVAIASQLETNSLVIFSAMISSTIGANAVHFTSAAVNGTTATGSSLMQAAGSTVFATGQPVSAVLAGLIAALVGKYLTGKTPLDMMLVPLTATLIGGVSGLGLAAVTTPLLLNVSAFIAKTMQINPLVGSISVSLVWALFLMTPASSAALAIALTLDPISSAAALIGTTSQFVAFTAMSFRQNNLGANIAQGVMTPKVQFPNLLVNPLLLVPSLLSAIVCAPVATILFGFRSTYKLAGLGLNSFIAPLAYAAQGWGSFAVYMLTGVILPAVISLTAYGMMKKAGLIQDNQLHLEIV